MLLLPSIFHGILGMITISVIAFSLLVFPNVFADNSETWSISIVKDASNQAENSFFPNELPVNDGDFVEWINQDTVTHAITSGLPDFPDYYGHFFDAGVINPGESKSVQIKITDGLEAFYYLCEVHPWMKGKIFVSGTPTSNAETINPIQSNKLSYETNESVNISGQVHQDFWGTDYQILIYDKDNKLIDIATGDFDEESKYSLSLNTDNFDIDGKYKLKLVYGLPSKVAETEFEYDNILSKNNIIIPTWIKNVGEYWCTEQIDDGEFLSAIQYLIQKDIIVISTVNGVGQSDQQVPDWVKNNTCWWSENQITDVDFLSGIEFLVNKGTIRV